MSMPVATWGPTANTREDADVDRWADSPWLNIGAYQRLSAADRARMLACVCGSPVVWHRPDGSVYLHQCPPTPMEFMATEIAERVAAGRADWQAREDYWMDRLIWPGVAEQARRHALRGIERQDREP